MAFKRFFLFISSTNEYQQPRRRQSVRYAANAASLGNLGKAVAAVAEVPGSKTVEALVTQDFSTRGTMACRPVKHGHNLRYPSVSGKTLINKETSVLLMVLKR